MQRFQSDLLGPHGMIHGAKLCWQAEALKPALVLVHSLIDQCAFLAFGDGPAGNRFQQWLRLYMEEGLRSLGLTPLEVWSNRCAIVHDAGFQSNYTRDGRARWITWFWGNGRIPVEVVAIPRLDGETVQVDALRFFQTVEEATETFVREVESDPALRAEVEKRYETRVYEQSWVESRNGTYNTDHAFPNRAARRRAKRDKR